MKIKSSISLSLITVLIFTCGIFVAFALPRLSLEQAKEIALSRIGGGDVVLSKLDYDDGRAEHELVIVYEQNVYDVNIDAQTGKIIEFKQKSIYFNKVNPTNDMLTQQQAVNIAKSKSGSGTVIQCELEYEDDIRDIVYDIEIASNNIKYSYKLNARTGAIIESDVDYY